MRTACFIFFMKALRILLPTILILISQGLAGGKSFPPTREVEALLEFKVKYMSNNTLGASQRDLVLQSWNAANTSEICDSWLGIVCTQSGHHIQEINLSGLGLSCLIAPHIGNLSFLSVLDLSNNSFSGTIPPQLQGCTSLEVLDLRANELTAPIPPSLASIASLRALNLCKNRFDGPIPLAMFMNGNASLLYYLGLCMNAFTGSMPPNLGLHLPRLLYLLLWQNNLTGSISPSLGNCSQLMHLQIHANQLSGPIPVQLGSLRNLQTLYLQENILTGPIPASLGNCTALSELLSNNNLHTGLIPHQLAALHKLQHLNLNGNKLAGSIPTSFENGTGLLVLSLSNNHLTGHIPLQLGSLSNLQSLLLWSNNLTGPIPASLGNCTDLILLQLQTNQLTGSIPNQLGSLRSVESIFLHENDITGHIPPSLGNCTNLTNLQLTFNQLVGPIPVELRFNRRLKSLNLAKNQLTGSIPPGLENCTALIDIGLAYNHLSGVIPTELGLALIDLQLLYAYDNNFTGSIPSSLGNCTNLLGIDLGSNQLKGAIPAELRNWGVLQTLSFPWNRLSGPLENLDFSNFTQLYSVELQFNELSGSLSKFDFSPLQQLQYLDLGSNRFTGEIPWDSISLCTSLFNLSLAYNNLTGEMSSKLAKLQDLKHLYLQGNSLHGGFPNLQGSKLSLLELDLSSNRLSGYLPPSLSPALNTVAGALNFSHNSFSGSLPLWLGQLGMAQSIDLSNNRFTGVIPEGLGDCVALTTLDLSCNQLYGELPLQLGHLIYLETLNLAFNNLSGELPSFLGSKLPHLRLLNVSFNNFTGPIPPQDEGVFRYVNASSFLGNPGLCGPVIMKVCAGPSSTVQDRRHYNIQLRNWKGIVLLAAGLFSVMVLLCLLVVVCYCRSQHVKTVEDEGTEMHDNLSIGIEKVKRFSAQELMKATQGYSEVNLLGQGGSSVVFKGVLEDGRIVAVKVLKDAYKGAHEAFLQEMHILSKLKHRNLVRILGSVRNLDIQALVLEYMENGSLETYLATHKELMGEAEKVKCGAPISYLEALSRVAIDVAEALAYLHHDYGDPIIHGDVKPSNILFDADLRPRLADFGLAKPVAGEARSVTLSSCFKGSIGYMAPEYAYASRITTKVDVYGYGVVLLRMLTGVNPTDSILDGLSLHEWVKRRLPADWDSVAEVDELLAAALVPITSDVHSRVIEQLLGTGVACTAGRPDDRPTIHQVLAVLTSYQNQKDLPTMKSMSTRKK